MTTVLITHPAFAAHDTGPHHPERAERMRVIDKVLEHEVYQSLIRHEAPLRDDDETYIVKAHRNEHLEHLRRVAAGHGHGSTHIDGDTVVSPGTVSYTHLTLPTSDLV